ncbi:DNA-binding protein [Fulvitalea axinellae]|uniref:DNA-binding protein n=1 Tax=Fulvitalea axinellae TaxID=1182444 RepID=A0AAU9D9Q2_9BACT|nr:DNA-binding protein [Fulvitalea axinellae]
MLKYKITQKANPQDREGPKKYYATPQTSGKKTLSAISRDITDMSSLSRGDISNVLLNLVDQIPKYLLDGQSVQLGELGSFRLSFGSEGAESSEDFNVSMIRNKKIIFTPGPSLKQELAKAQFELVKEKEAVS